VRDRLARHLDRGRAKVLTIADVARLTEVITRTIARPHWGQDVLDKDEKFRRKTATLRAAQIIVTEEFADISREIEHRNPTLEELEAWPDGWPDLVRILRKREAEVETAIREITRQILEHLRFLDLIAYPTDLGFKPKGWMVIADKLADETLQVVQALARRIGKQPQRTYGGALGPILSFVGEMLGEIQPDADLPGPERLRQILDVIRADRMRRREQF
jgi:hypothetical protein